jgi:5-methylcytosine-specific restriction endonuclease McrA
MKRCSHCQKRFPLDMFTRNRSERDGFGHYCRPCLKVVRRPSLAKYTKSEKFKIQQRRYHQSEKGLITSRRATQHYRQTEQGKLQEQRYRQSEARKLTRQRYDKSEKRRLAQKRYRQTEKGQMSKRLYREANKEKHELFYRAWLRTPEGKEYMVRRNYQRRASILRTPSEQLLTPTEWREIKRQFHNACAYCGIPESVSVKLTRDHLIPVSKSGLHTRENIVPACQPCNARKGAKLLTHPLHRK